MITVSRLYRRILLCIALLFSVASPRLDAQDTTLTVLAGWTVPGLDTTRVVNATVDAAYFVADLPAVQFIGSTSTPKIAGFPTSSGTEWALALSLPDFTLSDYVSALADTPLDELQFAGAQLILAPDGSEGSSVTAPAGVSDVVSGTLILPDGMVLSSSIDLSGDLASWLTALGLPTTGLPLTGTIPVDLLTGAIPGDDLATALYPLLNLTIALPGSALSTLSPPLPGSELTSLLLQVTGTADGPEFALSGTLEIGDLTFTVTAMMPAAGDDPSMTVSGDLSLADLAGVDVPALNGLAVSSVTLQGATITADVALAGVTMQVTSFAIGASGSGTGDGGASGDGGDGSGDGSGSGSGNALALTAPSLTLSDLISAAAGTPFDDLTFDAPTLVYSSQPTTNTVLPAGLATRLGVAQLNLATGLSLSAAASLSGNVGSLLSSIGASTTGLSLAGSFDVAALADPAAIPDLSLAIPLGTHDLADLTLANTQLVLAASGGVASAEVTADLQMTIAGQSVDLDGVRVARDSNGNTEISGPLPVAVLDALVPVPGLGATAANVAVTLGDAGTSIFLGGTVMIGASELGVEMNFDAGAGSRSISLLGDIDVGTLSGLSIPGLSNLALSNLTVAVSPTSSHTSGQVTFGGVSTTLVLFKEAGQPANNIALLADQLTLGSIVPAVAGTPLDALVFDTPTLMIAPAANGEQDDVATPAPVAAHRGEAGGGTMDLSPGIDIQSAAGLTGDVGALLTSLNVPTSGLPLNGTLGLNAFNGGAVSLPDLDITIPLPQIALPAAGLINFGDSQLRLRAQGGDPAVTVETSAQVLVGGRVFNFGTAITRGREGGIDFTAVEGTSPSTWSSPFGINWIDLDNLTLSARFGGGVEMAVGARADLGSINNVDAAISFRFAGGSFQDASLSLTGADIPLSAIPDLGTLPGADQFVLRDIIVSNTAIAGKAKMAGGPWLSTVLFKSQKPLPGWNLALLYEDVSLPDLIPGLPTGDPIISRIQLETAALIISQKGVKDDVGDLPPAAQERMVAIYGDNDRSLKLSNGVSLVSGFNPATDPEISNLLSQAGIGNDPLVLSGAIGGLFGGTPSFDLAAALPPVTLPPVLSEFLLLKEFETFFYVRLETLGPSLGVGVSGLSDMLVGVEDPTVFPPVFKKQELQAVIEFELNATGGVSTAVYAETTEPWENPFEIPGIVLDPGCLLGISVSATSEILMDVTAQTRIGDREVDLTGQAGLLGGYPAKAALIGQVSEMGLGDVMALSNAMVSAAGGTPPAADFPTAKLTETGIGFASPLATVHLNDVSLLGPGAYIEGNLWLIYDDEYLGRFKGTIDLLGLAAVGDIRDFDLATFAMRGNSLDVYARVDPLNPPYFKVRGNADILGVNSTVDMAVSSTGFSFFTEMDSGIDFGFDFLAYFDGPTNLTPAQLAEIDMGLDCGIELDGIQDFLAGDGADAIGDALGTFSASLGQAQEDLAAAEAAVATLTSQINTARAQVEAERGTLDQQLAAAEAAVVSAQNKVNSLNSTISSYQSNLKTCNQTKRICIWRNIWTGKCETRKTVPNLTKRAQCAAENAYWAGRIAAKTTELGVATGALQAARSSLAILQEGLEQLPIDLDPRVASLIVGRETALLTLQVTQDALAGLEGASDAAASGVSVFADASDVFIIEGGRFSGSMKTMLADEPVILDLNYSVEGESDVVRIPFKPTDPIYTFDHMQLLGLQILYGVSLLDDSAPQSYKDFVYDAYLTKKTLVEAELEIVNENNAVLELEGGDAILAAQPPTVIPPADIDIEAEALLTTVAIGLATATDVVDGDRPVTSDAPAQFPVGLTTVTWTAEDLGGNIGLATQRVRVIDSTPPVLTVPGDILGFEATSASSVIASGAGSATDIVDGTVAVTRIGPDSYQVGVTEVIWRATDAAGNTTERIQTIQVVDTTPPVVTAPPSKGPIEATGPRTTVNTGFGSGQDIVDGWISVTSDAPLNYPVGTTTVTWQATDAAGNTGSAIQTVTIQDTTPPTIAAPDSIIVEATGPRTVVALGLPTVTDVVGVKQIQDDAPADFPVGETIVTWTAIDSTGNQATDTQVVLILDTTPPVVTAAGDVEGWEATAALSVVDLNQISAASAVDLVDGALVAANDGGLFPVGTTPVIWSATDAHGNAASDTQHVEIIDTTPPTLTAPPDVAGYEATARLSPVDIDPSDVGRATDLVGVASFTDDRPEVFPVGTTTITWTAIDTAGNQTTALQSIEVVDTTPPIVSAPPAIGPIEATGPGTPISIGVGAAQDLVDGWISAVSDAPADYSVGITTVTWQASDIAGNTGSAIQTVTVEDTTPPTIVAPDSVIVEATGPRTVAALGQPVASDLVGVQQILNDAPADFPVGETIVTWTAIDAAGNRAADTQVVHVLDTTPPVVTAAGDVEGWEATAALSPVDLDLVSAAFAVDLVDGGVAVTHNAPTHFPVGTTPVLWSATDAHGNTATDTQYVEIVDTTPPVVTAPPDVLGHEATARFSPVIIDPAGVALATDLVGVLSFVDNRPNRFPVGTTMVTWTAVDTAGNETSVTQAIEVIDTTPPILTPPLALTVEAEGPTTLVDPGTATATDLVGVTQLSHDLNRSLPLGTVMVKWTARDSVGNTTTGTQPVTVEDTTPPVITLPADIVAYEATAWRSIIDIGQAAATDLVDLDDVVITNDAPADYPVGTTPVTWQAVDQQGNTVTAVQSVHVVDTTKPDISAPAPIVAFEATARFSPVPIGQAGATDLVGVASITSDAPDTYPVGFTTVTWTATDSAGNANSAAQVVEVVDTTPPVVNAPVEVKIEATGPLTPVNIGVATATDLVGVVSLVNDAPERFIVGVTRVIWTARDSVGNTSIDSHFVEVLDTTPPAVTPPDSILAFEAVGPLTPVDIGLATAFDLVSLELPVTHDAPASFPVGRTVVTWSAVDSVGNIGFARQTIQIVDTTPPVISFDLFKTELWPVNHKLVQVSDAISSTDLVDPAPALVVIITSNQPIDGPGDGATDPDWQIDEDAVGAVLAVQLRAERAGKDKDGRTYTVAVTATDQYGNESATSGDVYVPFSKGKGAARPVGIAGELPTAFGLHQNAPNPFNPVTEIRFDLPEPAMVELSIYDLLGQQVRRLVSEETTAGFYGAIWDGRDNAGQHVASGVYIYVLRAGAFRDVRKMTLLR